MRILTVPPDQHAHHKDELAQMHRLREMVFRGRLEWDVTVTETGEFDEYDQFDPTYVLAVTDYGRVVGCARLLPAQGPTMLELTFPQLLRDGSLNATSAMIESSRFCVDTTLPVGRGGGSFILQHSPCSLGSSNGRWRMATTRSSPRPTFASSAS